MIEVKPNTDEILSHFDIENILCDNIVIKMVQ